MDLIDLSREYELDYSIFTDIDERLMFLKDKLNVLNESERIIFFLYAELGSYRKVGRVLGFSHNTAGRLIRDIKIKLLC